MRMKKTNRGPHTPTLISLCIICILALIVQTGCSLAKVDSSGKESKDDVLCGVWVVSGKDGEGMDMSAFSSDNATRLLIYIENKNGERCTMSEVSGSIQSDLHENVVDGKSSSVCFGTLLVSPDHVTNARIYSIYQRTDGTRYAGNDLIPVTADLTPGESCTYTLESDKTAVSDGTTNSEAIKFQITFEVGRPSESVKVIELGKNNQILKTNTVDLTHPDAEADPAFCIEASSETAYVIIEDTSSGSDDEVTRTVYNRDNFSAENPYLYIIYQPNEDGLLISQALQITFDNSSLNRS